MRILYLDCGMGAAGDMLGAALLELFPDKEAYVEKLNGLQIPGVQYRILPSVKCGITGTRLEVTVHGEEEGELLHDHEHHHHHDHAHHHHGLLQDHEFGHHHHGHHHDHDHDHEHHHDHDHDHEHHHHHDHAHHHHAGMTDIMELVNRLEIPEEVKKDIAAVYGQIAEAESRAHGVPVTDIHFHEVGTMDAVADVTAVCLMMHDLKVDKIYASPVRTGFGSVHCAHGVLPVPAPATAFLLQGIPVYSGDIEGEMCTPTGAALLRYFVKDFSGMPVMSITGIGYGMGKKEFDAANCVRAMIGESAVQREAVAGSDITLQAGACEAHEPKTVAGSDTVIQLECNIDDMTAEEIGFAMDRLFDNGAREVFTVPVGMKKSRPGTMICVICDGEKKEDMLRILFQHTTTIGVRELEMHRSVLERSVETVQTSYGPVRKKVSKGFGVTREKYEYDDLAKIAAENGMSVRQIRDLLK